MGISGRAGLGKRKKKKKGGWTGHRLAFPSMLEAGRMMTGHTNLSTIIFSREGIHETKSEQPGKRYNG